MNDSHDFIETRQAEASVDFATHHGAEPRTAKHGLATERGGRRSSQRSEQECVDALAFKDAALREVDHRAKNTLQVAANFLALQARATQSAETRIALQEANRRLFALARVHELLVLRDDGVRDVHMPTLLNSIGDALRQSFAEAARVQLRVMADSISLAEQDAIPLGLLANELITNAYKHAFPPPAQGEIALSLSYEADDALVLKVSDSGVGRKQSSSSGLGHSLVQSFASHLKGDLAFSAADSHGTTVTLTIPRAGRFGKVRASSSISDSCSAK